MKDTEDKKWVYLSPPHLGTEEGPLVQNAFESNWITSSGPHLSAFEAEVAQYIGSAGAVALSSGTAAIHLALILVGVGRGDSVFCSSLTFIGSTNPICYQGAEPVLIDSEPGSWNMSPEALARAFRHAEKSGRLPKAVIIVNLYGQSADMERLLPVCEQYGVPAIEDAAESLGATYRGRQTGRAGKFGVFSFNGNKIITTSGGGMLVSDDLSALEKARFLSTQARDPAPHYQHSAVGFNYRLSNVLAAIGRGQLRILEARIEARRAIFERYRRRLGAIQGVTFMPEAPFGRATRWLTALLLDPEVLGVGPMDLVGALAADRIEARPVWKPLHLQPLFSGKDYFSHSPDHSVSDELFTRGVCLPSGSSLTIEEQDRAIDIIENVLLRSSR